MTIHCVAFTDLEWTSPIPGVRHKVQRSGANVLRLVEYSAAMEPHWCERGHLGYILEGRFEIEFAEGASVFEAGDGVTIPSGFASRHRARVLTPLVRAIFVEDAWFVRRHNQYYSMQTQFCVFDTPRLDSDRFERSAGFDGARHQRKSDRSSSLSKD